MEVNCDFQTRLSGTKSNEIPENKNDVKNANFVRILGMLSGICTYLNITRCKLLTSNVFNELIRCKTLMYLDLSYTSIIDISVLMLNCLDLKSLNISGCILESYEPLRNMIQLELLNLISSSINNSDYIQNL